MGGTKVYLYDLEGNLVAEKGSIAEAANEFKASRTTIRDCAIAERFYKGYFWSRDKYEKFEVDEAKRKQALETPTENPVKREGKKIGMSVESFRRQYDPMVIIREGVKNLRKGEILTNAEFVQTLRLPGNISYRDKLMLPEFEPYRGNVNASDVRWGHPDDMQQLKDDFLLK